MTLRKFVFVSSLITFGALGGSTAQANENANATDPTNPFAGASTTIIGCTNNTSDGGFGTGPGITCQPLLISHCNAADQLQGKMYGHECVLINMPKAPDFPGGETPTATRPSRD